jgi:hypothetical protein
VVDKTMPKFQEKGKWSVQKQYQLILQATMTGSSDKLVTISDQAFALLMYENYKDKWTKQGNEENLLTV